MVHVFQVNSLPKTNTKCPLSQKILTIVGGLVVLLIMLGFVFSGDETYTVTENSTSSETTNSKGEVKKVTKTDLLSQNSPNLKKVRFATDDYVGEEFDYYVLAEISDYYNYGFSDESKYYSISISDESIADDYENTYAYIDKTDPSKKADELLDLLLEDSAIIKVQVSIPVEKYTEGSNAYFEIVNWEKVDNK